LPKFVVDILEQLKARSSKENPFVFLKTERFQALQATWQEMVKKNESHKWDSRMLVNNLLRTFKTCCEKAGIKTNRRLNLHCLRKAYGTNLANVSTPVQTLKALMGHSSIKTTMEYYLCSCDSNEKKAVTELNRIMQLSAKEKENVDD
jgi:integrase